MNDSGNIYGFDEATIDTHAMKNSEWALISYLTQSKYGKYGNGLYEGENKQVYINNYDSFMTGCSLGEPTATASSTNICVNKYDIISDRGSGTGEAGGGASSTGNITGVYDINGGAWEYMMGSYQKYSGYSSKEYDVETAKQMGRTDGQAVSVWNSGYTGKTGFDNLEFTGLPWPEDKYYDLYTTNSTATACDGNPCKGHALNEVAGWYGDASNMVYARAPWSVRSGLHSNDAIAGVFYFSRDAGSAHSGISFRVVLAP